MNKIDRQFCRWVLSGLCGYELKFWMEYMPFIPDGKKVELCLKMRKNTRKQERMTSSLLSKLNDVKKRIK